MKKSRFATIVAVLMFCVLLCTMLPSCSNSSHEVYSLSGGKWVSKILTADDNIEEPYIEFYTPDVVRTQFPDDTEFRGKLRTSRGWYDATVKFENDCTTMTVTTGSEAKLQLSGTIPNPSEIAKDQQFTLDVSVGALSMDVQTVNFTYVPNGEATAEVYSLPAGRWRTKVQNSIDRGVEAPYLEFYNSSRMQTCFPMITMSGKLLSDDGWQVVKIMFDGQLRMQVFDDEGNILLDGNIANRGDVAKRQQFFVDLTINNVFDNLSQLMFEFDCADEYSEDNPVPTESEISGMKKGVSVQMTEVVNEYGVYGVRTDIYEILDPETGDISYRFSATTNRSGMFTFNPQFAHGMMFIARNQITAGYGIRADRETVLASGRDGFRVEFRSNDRKLELELMEAASAELAFVRRGDGFEILPVLYGENGDCLYGAATLSGRFDGNFASAMLNGDKITYVGTVTAGEKGKFS